MASLHAGVRAKDLPRHRAGRQPVAQRRLRIELLLGTLVLAAAVYGAVKLDVIGAQSTFDQVLVSALAGTVVVLAVLAATGWLRYLHTRAEAGALARIEAELAEAIERYRSLYDYHPDGVFTLDNSGRLVDMNAAAITMSGYTPEEMSALTIPDYVEAHEVERVTARFTDLLQGHIQRLETRLVGKDGATTDIAVTALPVTVGGVVVGAYGIAEDITERNRMQFDLEEARRVAEEASEAKSLFLANMSHEIRTPLTSVLAAGEMLEDTVTSESQRRLVETMRRSGARLLRLVDDILDFSRIEAGQATLRDDMFHLHDLLEELAADQRDAAGAKGVELTCTIDPAVPPELLGDADRVSQIVANLLDNAVKFTDSGHVLLEVSVDGSDGEHGSVIIRVADTGIGMSPDQCERIFESFRQADASITRNYGGTGLGLAICRQLVEMMGGTLEVDSTVAVGTEFVVRVPLGLVEPADAA